MSAMPNAMQVNKVKMKRLQVQLVVFITRQLLGKPYSYYSHFEQLDTHICLKIRNQINGLCSPKTAGFIRKYANTVAGS